MENHIGNVGQNIHPSDLGPPLMLDLNLMCSVVGPTRFGQGRVVPVGVEPDEVGPFFKLFFRNFFVRLFLGVGGREEFFFDFGLFCELHVIDSSLAGIRHSRMSVL